MTAVEIGGKQYPVRFTMAAMIAIQDKYGKDGSTKLFAEIEDGDFKALTWLAALMIKQGCAYYKLMGIDDPDLTLEPPDEEQLAVLLGVGDLRDVMSTMMAAVTGGSKQTVDAAAAKDKKK